MLEEYFINVLEELTILWKAAVAFKMGICKCSTDHMDHLGHVIYLGGFLEVSVQKIDVICRLEHPTTEKKLGSFWGLWNILLVFWKFEHGVAQLNKHQPNGQPQTFQRLSNHDITTLETQTPKLVESFNVGSPSFARRLHSKYGPMKPADRLFSTTKATLKNSYTNLIWVC